MQMKKDDDFVSLYDWQPTFVKPKFRAKSKWRQEQNANENRGRDYKPGRDECIKIRAYLNNDVPDEVIMETFAINKHMLNKIKHGIYDPSAIRQKLITHACRPYKRKNKKTILDTE